MLRLAVLLVFSSFACGDDTTPLDGGTDAGDAAGDAPGGCLTDEECSDETFCNGTEICDPGSADADALGCIAGLPACMEGRVCDEDGARCVTECVISGDADGDGVDSLECGGPDCDDGNAARFPGNAEVCDVAGVDEDCNPSTLGGRDLDGDGAVDSACCNEGVCGTDCDDARPGTFPGATEVCNETDDDCDGTTDEDLPVFGFLPDCDGDNFGATEVPPIMLCAAPIVAPTCPVSGVWVTAVGDCDDTNAARNPGNAELCNAVDDDCDELVDDIVDGVVACVAGEDSACANGCGVAGTTTCAADCLGFEACSSTVNELCNYCDDDGDGNFDEEAVLATDSEVDRLECGTLFGVASCTDRDVLPTGFVVEATILDGLTNDTAGALWMNPSDWVTGWGIVEFDVTMQVRAVPTMSGGSETPLGGWSIVLGYGGTLGVGTPRDRGIPRTVPGIAGSWSWATTDTCFGPDRVPDQGDAFGYQRLNPPFIEERRPAGASAMGWDCVDGEPINSVGTDFDGDTAWLRQRMRIRYTPDDPTTDLQNEEQVELFAQSPAGGPSQSATYRADDAWPQRPAGDIPVGSSLMIGITAGTYTASGFSGPPATLVFGVPVEARVQLWRFVPGPTPRYEDIDAALSRDRICAP